MTFDPIEAAAKLIQLIAMLLRSILKDPQNVMLEVFDDDFKMLFHILRNRVKLPEEDFKLGVMLDQLFADFVQISLGGR